MQKVMINEDFVIAVAALFQRFHLAYLVDEEAKIKLKKSYQHTQDHTLNRWMN